MTNFHVILPDENEPGYMAFLDDFFLARDALNGVSGSWNDVVFFLEGIVSYDDAHFESFRAFMRSLSKPQFQEIFEQIAEAISQKKAFQEMSNDKSATLSPEMHKPTRRYGSSR